MRAVTTLILLMCFNVVFGQVDFYIDGQWVDQTNVQNVNLSDLSPSIEHVELWLENTSGTSTVWSMDHCMLNDDANIDGIDLEWAHEDDGLGGVHFLFGPTPSTPCWAMPLAAEIQLDDAEHIVARPGFEVFGQGCEMHRFYVVEQGQYIDSIDVQFCSVLNTEESLLPEFDVYPNPASDFIKIKFGLNEAQLSIITIDGNFLMKDILVKNEEIVSLKEMSPGSYFVEISSQTGVIQRKRIQVLRK